MSNSSNENVSDDVLVRYLSGEASEEEEKQVKHWMLDDLNKSYFDQITLLWESSESAKDFDTINTKIGWEKVESAIKPKSKINKSSISEPKKKSIIYPLLRVEAVITVLVSFYYLLPRVQGLFDSTNSIATTSNSAKVTLSDGSKVYLNKNSKLIYSEVFDGKTRSVELIGEAFFEIAKDANKPFLVTIGQSIIEVVGTSFNVKNALENNVIVTVLTGKVLMYDNEDKTNSISLSPAEQGVFEEVSGLSKKDNTDTNFLSWKTGNFVFQNKPLPDVISDLNRYYNRQIEIVGESTSNCTLTSTYHKQKLNDILDELELVLPVSIRREKERIIITGKGCD